MCHTLSLWEWLANSKCLAFAISHIVVNCFDLMSLPFIMISEFHHAKTFRKRDEICIKQQMNVSHKAIHFPL